MGTCDGCNNRRNLQEPLQITHPQDTNNTARSASYGKQSTQGTGHRFIKQKKMCSQTQYTLNITVSPCCVRNHGFIQAHSMSCIIWVLLNHG